MHGIKGSKDLMYFTLWVTTALDCRQSNMPSRQGSILRSRQKKILKLTGSSWIASGFALTGAGSFAPAIPNIINGRNGYSCKYLTAGTTKNSTRQGKLKTW